MPKSTLLDEMDCSGDYDGKEITVPLARFEACLAEQGYDLAVNGSPYNSAEGGYLGTIDAVDLLADYLTDHPDQERYEEQLAKHCYEVGPLFNPEKWHYNTEPPSDERPSRRGE